MALPSENRDPVASLPRLTVARGGRLADSEVFREPRRRHRYACALGSAALLDYRTASGVAAGGGRAGRSIARVGAKELPASEHEADDSLWRLDDRALVLRR